LPGTACARPPNFVFIFFETAMTLRPKGGDISAGTTCRGIGGSQTLHVVNQVIRVVQYGMRFGYDKGSA
jgi:hypothetical protein